MTDWRISIRRRDMLRALAAGAACSPILRAAHALAQGEAGGPKQKRVILFFTPNGLLADQFVPRAGFTMGPALANLQPHADKLVFLDHLMRPDTPSNHHDGGYAVLLTGKPYVQGASGSTGGGVSIDQRLGAIGRSQGKIGSFYFSTESQSQAKQFGTTLSYAGVDSPVPFETRAGVGFDALFSGVVETGGGPNPDTVAQNRANEKRRRVLDFSRDRVNAAKSRLSRDNRDRLEAHESAIADLRTRVTDLDVETAVQCSKPSVNRSYNPQDFWNEKLPPVIDAQKEMLLHAMACGVIDVGLLQLPFLQQFRFLPGVSDPAAERHSLSHFTERPNPTVALKDNEYIQNWYASVFASMIDWLKTNADADGAPMIDNTVLLWMSENGDLGSHDHRDLRWIMAGNLEGRFKQKAHLSLGNAPTGNLFLSLLRAFGDNATSFGNSTGELTALRA